MDKTNSQFKEERIKTADENYPVSPITRKIQNKVMTYQLSPNRLILNHRKAENVENKAIPLSVI